MAAVLRHGPCSLLTPMVAPLPRMLVVDDEDSILFAMRDYFVLLGYEVDAAHGAGEAERLIATRDAYAVAVIDLSLEGAGHDTRGLDLVTAVRAGHPTTTVIVLFTAFGTHTIEREARRRGAVFMQKPVSLSVLGAVIEEQRSSADASGRDTRDVAPRTTETAPDMGDGLP